MRDTIRLIDSLCSVDMSLLRCVQNQTHKHTFTCYKRVKKDGQKLCRFGAPFWPMNSTKILIPLSKDDGRRKMLKAKYKQMRVSLEHDDDEDFNDTLEAFLQHHGVSSDEEYADILSAGINRPTVLLRRTMAQKWINSFNPWVASVLRSNMDIEFILDEYSCAIYVVVYVNKSDRVMSNLQRTLQQLRDEYPDMDYAELMKVGVEVLNAVEMSSQEAAWYLLRLDMSESSRVVEFIATCMPEDRHHVRKTKQQMDEEELAGDALDIWKENVVERYERRPMNTMADVSLAQFVALYEQKRDKKYRLRRFPKVIRYVNYNLGDVNNYNREMVLLHVPFRNEVVDVLDNNKYTPIYDEKMAFINEARKEFEANVDIANTLLYIAMLNQKDEDDENGGSDCTNDRVRNEPVKDDFAIARDAKSQPDNADIILANMEKMSSVIRKRENVMTAEQYCKAMRKTNVGQRNLILECLFRI